MPAFISSPRMLLPIPILVAALFVGCATTSAPAAPPPPMATTLTCKFPTTTPLQETKEMQLKGGVQIFVAIQPFQCVPAFRMTKVRAAVPFAEQLLANSQHPGRQYIETTKTPYFAVTPDRLKVTLKVVNQLSRVFRGAGTVVQFTVAGKTWANKQEDYAEFTNVIIPPRGEQQIELYGPPMDSMPPSGNLGLFLYDVVTKTDAAGNITDKQNYEWYYNYGLQTKEEPGLIEVTKGWE
jgi:hypothetical protein